MTDRNEGKPWSEMDLKDLDDFKGIMTIEELASYLMRSVEEVEAKIAELSQSRPPQHR
jgi:hypothetical protein